MNKQLNIFGKLAGYFLYNPALTILLLAAIVLGGVLAYHLTPKQYNPEVVMPAFRISVAYPGATAREVEEFITFELEEKIAEIPGVDAIYSQSFDGGLAVVTVEFRVGEDLEDAKTKVQAQLAGTADLLRGTMQPPIIKTLDPENIPVLTYGFTSKLLSQNEIRRKVINLMNALKRVDGVANLELHGGETRALRIILDPGRMELAKVSIQDVEAALAANNINVFAGNLKNGQYLRQVVVDGTLTSAEEAGLLRVGSGVKLSSIASISDASSERTSRVRLWRRNKEAVTAEDAVFLSIAKRKGENVVTVAKKVHERLQQEMKLPQYENLQLHPLRDDAAVAAAAIEGLGSNLIQSIGIVFIVLLLFLGFRSALLVSFAIPLSLALVFMAGYASGQTINRITLFALILSLGLLVDSATVVVENIARHTAGSNDKKALIVQAVNEVGIGLFLSTITSVIVFLPTAFISGMMGAYMGPLSFFVPTALVMSLLVAYILTPFLATVMMSSRLDRLNRLSNRVFIFLTQGIENIPVLKKALESRSSKSRSRGKTQDPFTLLAGRYRKLLQWLLAKKKRQHIFLLATFGILVAVLSFPIFQLVHFRMLPSADKEQYYVYLDAPEGTDIYKMEQITEVVVRALFTDKETISVKSFTGQAPILDFNGMYRNADARSAPHLATLRVNLTSPESRTAKSEELVRSMRKTVHQDAVINEYIRRGVTIRFVEDPPGPPVRATLLAKVKGPDVETREAIAREVQQLFKKTAGVVDSDTSIETPVFRTLYRVDYEKAMQSGVSSYQIAAALRAAISGSQVSQFHVPEQNEISFVEIQFQQADRDQVQDLSRVFIKSAGGGMVPLSSVTKVVESRSIPARYLDERDETVYVSAEMAGRSVIYAVIDMLFAILQTGHADFIDQPKSLAKPPIVRDKSIPKLSQLTLSNWDLFHIAFKEPNGKIYRIEWGGEWKMTLENFRDLGLAMMVAFLLIYGVLVAQFKSFTAPALITTTVPLGFIGIMPGFALLDMTAGIYLTATSLIGFIALMGIVVNNAILYLEYYSQLLHEGKSIREALLLAGETRLRPIVLTSATTVLGSLTIAGDPVWSGLAWSIVFGLSLSTAMTLGVFPVLLNLLRPKLV